MPGGHTSQMILEQLEADPHPLLADLREHAPVAWIEELGGWLVTRHDLVLDAMRDADTFTVDHPGFSTARVIGPSMLSLDGAEHEPHRAPFMGPFRVGAVKERFAAELARTAAGLIDGFAKHGQAELRRRFAGPLAAATMASALGLGLDEVLTLLAWYDRIVASVTEITAGRGDGTDGRAAFTELRERLEGTLDTDSLLGAAARSGTLTQEQIVSNAAVLLFGGIETTEGMICNALCFILADPAIRDLAAADANVLDAAIEESLRLEPAAAVIDRYATTDVALGDAQIKRGQLVRLSIAAANRDPAVYPNPDVFDMRRPRPRSHVAFAQGPHVCVGVHLARLEARVAVSALIGQLPNLRLAEHPHITGLVFRKPRTLHALWDRV
jgi:cytochrome P450